MSERSAERTTVNGALTGSREMHVSFYGTAASLSNSNISGIESAESLVTQLVTNEWEKDNEGKNVPAGLMAEISKLASKAGSQFESVLDFLSEAINAEQLYQLFGVPQVPGSLQIALKLQDTAETAFSAAQEDATKKEQAFEWIVAEIKKTLYVWYVMEEARHRKAMEDLEQTEASVLAVNATGAQAKAETFRIKDALAHRKAEIALQLKMATQKVETFVNQIMTATINPAERIIQATQRQTAQLPSLDLSKAIPVEEIVI